MRGNKPEIFGDNVYANPGVSEEYERYAVPGEYLTDQQFANLLHEAEKYLGYPYVWGGASPSTSFDCSGFVNHFHHLIIPPLPHPYHFLLSAAPPQA